MEDCMINEPDQSRQWPITFCPGGCGATDPEDCQCCEEGHGEDCGCRICESERRSDEDTVRTNAAFQDGGWVDTTREAEE